MTQKILIAEDDPSVAKMLKTVLIAQGYEGETAQDGDEVLSKATSCHPDLILLDVMMPKKDGYEVLKILRASTKTMDIPVIMVTGKAEVPDKVKGLGLGAGDYLTKPFNVAELVARVKVHLKGKRGTEEKIKAEKLMALSTMINGLAHEVRNPLAVIGGFAKILLKKTQPDDDRYRYITAISREVSRLERMLNDIYNLKTIALKEKKLCSVNNLLQKVLQTSAGELSSRKITLSLNLETSQRKLLVDPVYFKLGLEKIVRNAIEAMPEGGKLTATTECDPEFVYIRIADEGCGIDEDHLRYIFDPFFTSKMEGTGLGLTVALKVFQAHGCKISVKSTPAVSTEVIVECPLHDTEAGQTGNEPGDIL